jgi:hypothetical protein
MESAMFQDQGVRDRIRQAEEFLDPSKSAPPFD